MNFTLTDEHKMIRDAARDFANTELLPGVIERDEHQEFPTDQIKKLGDLGFLGMMVDPKYGGGGMDSISYVLAMEEISKIDSSVSVVMSVNNSLVCWGLEMYGTEEQKEKYLKRLASGEIIGAFCLSEPEAGSDATSQKTTAIEQDAPIGEVTNSMSVEYDRLNKLINTRESEMSAQSMLLLLLMCLLLPGIMGFMFAIFGSFTPGAYWGHIHGVMIPYLMASAAVSVVISGRMLGRTKQALWGIPFWATLSGLLYIALFGAIQGSGLA